VRRERAHPAHPEKSPPDLVVGAGAQPLLVNARDAGQHLGQPRGALPVAAEGDEVVLAERGQPGQRRERYVDLPVHLSARPQLSRDPALAGRREPLGAALGEREIHRALGQRPEADLVQAGGRPQHRCHRRVGAGRAQKRRQVVVEAQPAPDPPLHGGRLVVVERTLRVCDQSDPAPALRRGADVDHHAPVGMSGMRQRLADVAPGDRLVAGARREAAERAQGPGQGERRGGGQHDAVLLAKLCRHARKRGSRV